MRKTFVQTEEGKEWVSPKKYMVIYLSQLKIRGKLAPKTELVEGWNISIDNFISHLDEYFNEDLTKKGLIYEEQ